MRNVMIEYVHVHTCIYVHVFISIYKYLKHIQQTLTCFSNNHFFLNIKIKLNAFIQIKTVSILILVKGSPKDLGVIHLHAVYYSIKI